MEISDYEMHNVYVNSFWIDDGVSVFEKIFEKVSYTLMQYKQILIHTSPYQYDTQEFWLDINGELRKESLKMAGLIPDLIRRWAANELFSRVS